MNRDLRQPPEESEPAVDRWAETRSPDEPAQLPRTTSTPEVETAPTSLTLMESLYRVLVHNDDVTPFEYVTAILIRVFMLSEEMSEHIALTAHSEGIAIVIIRPRSEAERLGTVANRSARADGFPLTFSVEPDN